MPNPVWDLVSDRERRRPSEPLLTHLAADGSRTELSARTLANNVAKAAGALRDEAMLDPGTVIGLRIPWHWQRSVWALAAWSVGIAVDLGSSGEFDLIAPGLAVAPGVPTWVVSMHPFGLPNASLPDGADDAALMMRLQPDAFLADEVDGTTLALRANSHDVSIAEVLDRAAQLVAPFTDAEQRRFVVLPGDDVDGVLWCTVAALVGDAAVVLVDDGVDADRVAAAERARVARRIAD